MATMSWILALKEKEPTELCYLVSFGNHKFCVIALVTLQVSGRRGKRIKHGKKYCRRIHTKLPYHKTFEKGRFVFWQQQTVSKFFLHQVCSSLAKRKKRGLF